MNKLNNTKNFLLFFIIFLTSFLLWVFASSKIEYVSELSQKVDSSKSLQENLKDALLTKDLDLTLFWQVYNLVSKNYYSNWETTKKDMEYGLIKWYMSSLWDKFSEFMTPEETKDFEWALSWDFEWIWAVIEPNELWVVVDRVIKWSPALNNWILKWDIVVEANWTSLKWLTANEAVNFIKWPAGSKVILKIIRQWENDFITKEITREKIVIPSVDQKVFAEDRIWYISLNIFWDNTSQEFLDALLSMNNDNIDWIIIDLRDNWGWYLESAVEILSNFVKNWELLVTTKYKDSIYNDHFYSHNTWNIYNKKIVVLINWNSASASEITAWALRDYNKAILVWEKSYWKWSVQQPFDLPDWSLLKLTIAKWYTPKDYSIDKNWISPDIQVKYLPEDFTNLYDRQLEEAKKVLKDFVKYDNIGLVVSEYEKNNTSSWALVNSWSWTTNE